MLINARKIFGVVLVAVFIAVFLPLGAVHAQVPDLSSPAATEESSPTALHIGIYNNPLIIFLNDEQQPDGIYWSRLLSARAGSWRQLSVNGTSACCCLSRGPSI